MEQIPSNFLSGITLGSPEAPAPIAATDSSTPRTPVVEAPGFVGGTALPEFTALPTAPTELPMAEEPFPPKAAPVFPTPPEAGQDFSISRYEDKEELFNILGECVDSSMAMAESFYPHHCYRPFGSIHTELFKILDDDTVRAAAICCPRGFGKTTLMGLVFPAKKILFRDCHYILFISSTFKKAVGDLKTLANELQTNDYIKKIFGDLKGVQWAEGSGELELNSDIKIEAKGAGNQIRGLKYRQYRPDLIIIDDLEDPEEVRNEDRRKILKEWFFADLMNSINLNTTRVVILGTILHEDGLLNNILDETSENKDDFLLDDAEKRAALLREQFTTLRLEACDDNFKSNWPDYMSDVEIYAKAEAYRKRGLLDVFFREYRNLPTSKQGATFQQEFFKHYKEDWKTFNALENVIIVDPSKTTNVSSDNSAIVGVAFDGSKNKIYLRDVVNEKLHPDEIYKEACDMADRLGTCNIGMEVTSLNEFITYPFLSYIKTRKKFYNLVELKARGAKVDRIRALAPFYRMGAIYHNEATHVKAPIETQLMSFPRSKRDDVSDAFAYIVSMFDLGERFFSQDISPEAVEDEYKDLEDEDYQPISGWRIAP